MIYKILAKEVRLDGRYEELLSAEFVRHASTPYNKIGRHLDLIKANKTSSGALRPIFPKRLLLAVIAAFILFYCRCADVAAITLK